MWYETLFLKILNMSITGGLVISVLVLLRPVLIKGPRIFTYSLWLVALFRLLCPVSLPADFSMLGLFNLPVTENASIEYIPEDIVSDPFPEVDFLVADATERINAALPQGWEQARERPMAKWIGAATFLWLVGAACLLGRSLHSMARLQSQLGDRVRLEGCVYLSPHLQTALVIGIVNPRIYLPDQLDARQRAHVILHEQQHIRRYDHLWKTLAFSALCLHWFNPLVWLAFYLADSDMEMSCDEAVIRNMDRNLRCDYSQTLLQLASGRKRAMGGHLCFCEGQPGGRIRHILKWKRPGKLTWLSGFTVCLLLCASLLTDPVFALEVSPQPFTGRMHMELAEGYDYVLLDDPMFYSERPNIIIYRKSAFQPVAEGCISLDFSPITTPFSQGKTQEIHLRDWKHNQAFQALNSSFGNLSFDFGILGAVQIQGHNTQRWSMEESFDYGKMIQSIYVTGPDTYTLARIIGEEYLRIPCENLDHYGFWTDRGNLCVDLSGAAGNATILLYEAYTDRLAGSFLTDDAARNDCHMFTGLTAAKEYYLTITGGEGAEITVFTKG